MRAWSINEFGGPEVFSLKNIADPEPKPGWVLIDTLAVGIKGLEKIDDVGLTI